LDKFLAIQKKTLEQFRDEHRSKAQTRIRRTLVAAELIKQEGLSVEGEEVIDRVGQISLMAGERGDNLRQALATEDGVSTVAQNMLHVKLQERLVQIAKGEGEAKAEVEGKGKDKAEVEVEDKPEGEAEAKAEVKGKANGKAEAEIEDKAEPEASSPEAEPESQP
jgi:trigger factor